MTEENRALLGRIAVLESQQKSASKTQTSAASAAARHKNEIGNYNVVTVVI